MLFKISTAFAAFVAVIAPLAQAIPTPSTTYIQHSKRSSTGRGTVYYQNGGIGSCGQRMPDDSMIVAMSPAHGNMCGRQLRVSNVGSNDGVAGAGQIVMVTVMDTCPSCGPDDLDFSVGAWNALTNGAAPGTFTAAWDVM